MIHKIIFKISITQKICWIHAIRYIHYKRIIIYIINGPNIIYIINGWKIKKLVDIPCFLRNTSCIRSKIKVYLFFSRGKILRIFRVNIKEPPPKEIRLCHLSQLPSRTQYILHFVRLVPFPAAREHSSSSTSTPPTNLPQPPPHIPLNPGNLSFVPSFSPSCGFPSKILIT